MLGDMIGIDLGTTYSSIAYIDDDGLPRISPDAEGCVNTPSFIVFDNMMDILVGSTAKESCILYPDKIVSGIKRHIGTDYQVKIGGRSYTPSQLSAVILKKLLDDFEEAKGFRPEKAVITCPAYFGNEERLATKLAGEMAGLKDITLLNEPTAAAICFGFGQDDDCKKRIMVYDLGGGTFDITILEIDGKKFNAVSTDGERHLGGKDWDDALVEVIIEKIADTSGMTITGLRRIVELMQRLRIDSEIIKKKLTDKETVNMTLQHRGNKFRYTVTREEFEKHTESLMHSTLDIMDRALDAKDLKPADIDEIVLVGGSTLMPHVHRMISEKYPANKVSIYDPHESIAKGAAIYAMNVYGESESHDEKEDDNPKQEISNIRGLDISNVLSKSFGVMASRSDRSGICNIIFRNEALPITAERTFYLEEDCQRELEIQVYESFSTNTPENEWIPEINGKLVNSFRMELPFGAELDSEVVVTFTATAEGILTAVAECMGEKKDCRIEHRN